VATKGGGFVLLIELLRLDQSSNRYWSGGALVEHHDVWPTNSDDIDRVVGVVRAMRAKAE
jgi:hypothetical protein